MPPNKHLYCIKSTLSSAATSTTFGNKQQMNEFNESIRPIVIVLKVFGVFPIQIKTTGAARVLPVSKCYCLGVSAVGTVLLLIYRLRKVWSATTSYHADSWFEVITITMFVSAPLFSLSHSASIIEHVNYWAEFQASYHEVFGHPLKLRFILRSTVTTLTAITLALCFYNSHILLHDKEGKSDLLTVIMTHVMEGYNTCLPALISVAWYLECHALTTAATSFRCRMEQDLENHWRVNKDVSKYTSLWLQLSNLTTGFGLSTYRTQFLVIYYHCLVMVFSLHMYITGNNTKADSLVKDVFNQLAVVFSFLCLLMTCNGASVVTAKVSSEFIETLLRNSCSKNSIPWRENETFLRTIRSHPPKISLAGYVDINRQFCIKVLSAMSTYIIFFIQLTKEK